MRIDSLSAVEKIVREERAVFGELPAFEAPYTFIADFLPYASADGMEHRNSTILTGSASLGAPDQMLDMLSTAAHEFFHSWNVERIRPRSLEPFRLDAPNPSGELWFAEGFTSYYEPLVMQRSGLWNIGRLASRLGDMLDTVIRSPARKYRSAEEVSRLAQFVDQASWSDPTNLDNTFLSYYTWGAAIGLGLDLSLRVRTDHKVTLDHYMRRMWQDYGRAKAPRGGQRRAAVHDPGSSRRAGGSLWRSQLRERVLRSLHSGARRGRLSAAAGARRAAAAEERSGPRMDRSGGARLQRRRGTDQRADDRRYAGLCRRPRSRRRAAFIRRSAVSGPGSWRKPFSAASPATKSACRFGASRSSVQDAHDRDRGGPAPARRTRRTRPAAS